MKAMKFAVAAVSLLLLAAAPASARGFLIKGGVEFPHYNITDLDEIRFASITGWHAGVGYQTGTLAGFSLQPELLYQRSGFTAKYFDGSTDQVRTDNIQAIANIQWGVELIIFRPFLFIAPFASYNLSQRSDFLDLKKWDYGLGAGIGFDIGGVQVTGKYNWAFSGVVDWDSYAASAKDIRANTGALVVSIAYIF